MCNRFLLNGWMSKINFKQSREESNRQNNKNETKSKWYKIVEHNLRR